jgi:sterol desaturase/sphingolipid hydroxylase (fatty acid hydroxylase superfamily)
MTSWFLYEAARMKDLRPIMTVWSCLAVVVLGYAFVVEGMAALTVIAAALAGWVTWGFVEYHLHRHGMHWRPEDEKLHMMRENILAHDNHHRKPSNPNDTYVMPAHFAPLIIITLALVAGMVVPLALSGCFFLGIGIGYVSYELVHYACHRCRMDGPIGTRLKQHHALHHFRDDDANFGVTTTVWDHVFRTFKTMDMVKVPRGPAAQTANLPKRG